MSLLPDMSFKHLLEFLEEVVLLVGLGSHVFAAAHLLKHFAFFFVQVLGNINADVYN